MNSITPNPSESQQSTVKKPLSIPLDATMALAILDVRYWIKEVQVIHEELKRVMDANHKQATKHWKKKFDAAVKERNFAHEYLGFLVGQKVEAHEELKTLVNNAMDESGLLS